MTKARTRNTATLAAVIWLAACGSDGSDQANELVVAESDVVASTTEPPVADSTPPSEESEPATTQAAIVETTSPDNDPGADDEPAGDTDDLPDVVLEEVDDGPSVTQTAPAMGGIRFEASVKHSVSIGNDFTSVRIDDPSSEFKPEANVALITQSVNEEPIATIADYMGAVATDPSAQVVPTGDALDLLGYRLTGYEVSNDATTEDPMLFSVTRAGADVASVAAPFPYSRVYLAETPAGVLQAAIEGLDAEHANQAAGAFRLLVESIEFTGPGLDAPLPPGEFLASSTPGAPPEAASPIDGGPPSLEALFEAVDPGTYLLLNTGLQASVDVPEGWFVQPNFPGFVIFTAPDSQGPGDRDLVIIRNVTELVPTGAGPNAVGPAEAITDVNAFFDNLPSGVTVSGVTEIDFGAVTGTQFDLATDPTSGCSDDDPCELSLITTFDFVKTLQANFDHRIWWVDAPDGSLVMVAMALDEPAFIDRATELAVSMNIAGLDGAAPIDE